MPVLRVLLHAVIILAGLHLLRFIAQGVHASLLLSLLTYLSAGWFVVLSLITSAAMHNQKSLVIAVIILVPLGAWPYTNIDAFARTIVPIGVGILLGTALRPAVREWTTHDRSTTQSVHRDE
jgi:accessory gene regulator protein AgrB